MSKKILITSTDVMMLQFLVPHAFHLKDCGYEVEVAVSDVEGHIEELKELFEGKVKMQVVELVRSPFSTKNLKGLSQLRGIIKDGGYDIIWTNEPVMGVMTRLAAKSVRTKAKIMYIAHGFHFYKGAPKKNWIMFFPIEKIFSRITDEIITINQEDYAFAKKHFHKPKVVKLPGIGINTAKFEFSITEEEKLKKRAEIGIDEKDRLIISVGELETRKNHETAIRAFSKSGLTDTKLIICGVGSKEEEIRKTIAECGMQDRVFLLGYRYDIRELCHSSDAFLFVTYQEGLSVALMEAMSVGLPLIISRIRGNVDLVEEGDAFFCDPKDISSCADAIKACFENTAKWQESAENNRSRLNEFDFENVKKLLYNEIECLLAE